MSLSGRNKKLLAGTLAALPCLLYLHASLTAVGADYRLAPPRQVSHPAPTKHLTRSAPIADLTTAAQSWKAVLDNRSSRSSISSAPAIYRPSVRLVQAVQPLANVPAINPLMEPNDPPPTADATVQRDESALSEMGAIAFSRSCTDCHNAERSLGKNKSHGKWLATVRRMAAKDDADVAPEEFEAIAAYLTNMAGPVSGAEGSEIDDLTISATISTLWRGGNDNLENPDFFVDAWVSLDWQPAGPISGNVTACTSCHSQDRSRGGVDAFTLELVEASATLDLVKAIGGPVLECSRLEAKIKAGRFVVPFGAISGHSHPGAMRTVTRPLMFNMGRRVGSTGPLQPVIPMPYSDEGANLHVGKPIGRNWSASMDFYAVNGLQGGGGTIFTSSRDYEDNNSNPAIGGRATIGNGAIKIGGSLMSGELQDEGRPLQMYRLAGGDATARFGEWGRFYFEYAIRNEDTAGAGRLIAYGTVTEVEWYLCRLPRLSLLARYDTLEHRGAFGTSSIERFTWGANWTLRGGSVLTINHERWHFLTGGTPRTDILGFRWTAVF